jgi:hypothetical protein
VLSLGEQQRIAFLRLLLHRPSLAFLDEARAPQPHPGARSSCIQSQLGTSGALHGRARACCVSRQAGLPRQVPGEALACCFYVCGSAHRLPNVLRFACRVCSARRHWESESGPASAGHRRAGHGDRGSAVRPAAARRPLVRQRGPPRAARPVAHARAGARRGAALAPEHAAGVPGAAAGGRRRGGAAWVKPWQGASASPANMDVYATCD